MMNRYMQYLYVLVTACYFQYIKLTVNHLCCRLLHYRFLDHSHGYIEQISKRVQTEKICSCISDFHVINNKNIT